MATRFMADKFIFKIKIDFWDLNEMLPLCDFVCVVVALTAETRHLFKYEQFALMKKTAIFCNVSRGDTVDQVCDRVALKSQNLSPTEKRRT